MLRQALLVLGSLLFGAFLASQRFFVVFFSVLHLCSMYFRSCSPIFNLLQVIGMSGNVDMKLLMDGLYAGFNKMCDTIRVCSDQTALLTAENIGNAVLKMEAANAKTLEDVLSKITANPAAAPATAERPLVAIFDKCGIVAFIEFASFAGCRTGPLQRVEQSFMLTVQRDQFEYNIRKFNDLRDLCRDSEGTFNLARYDSYVSGGMGEFKVQGSPLPGYPVNNQTFYGIAGTARRNMSESFLLGFLI
jgi:hypothetical protein